MQAIISVWSPTVLGATLHSVPGSLLVSIFTILSKPKSVPELPELFLTLHFVSPVPQGPEVRDLANELHKVIDWIPFGLNLGLKMEELKTIEANYPTLQRRRLEMLEEWQKKVTPTWSAVVQALVGIGMRRLASELAQKNGLLNIGSIHIICIKVLRLNLVVFLYPIQEFPYPATR